MLPLAHRQGRIFAPFPTVSLSSRAGTSYLRSQRESRPELLELCVGERLFFFFKFSNLLPTDAFVNHNKKRHGSVKGR